MVTLDTTTKIDVRKNDATETDKEDIILVQSHPLRGNYAIIVIMANTINEKSYVVNIHDMIRALKNANY